MASISIARRPILPLAQDKQAQSLSQATQSHTTQHSELEWMVMYPHIERLYIHERRKLRDIMWHMEIKHSFKATADMYKKRFAKWGFHKNTKTNVAHSSGTRRAVGGTREGYGLDRSNSKGGARVIFTAKPPLSKIEGMDLFIMTMVRDWSLSYFESSSLSSMASAPPEMSDVTVNYTIKLIAQLLARGEGLLAGKLARKAFLQVEDTLRFGGPAIMWNLFEVLHNIVGLKQSQLFDLLLTHLINLATSQYQRTHPFIQLLLCLQKKHSLDGIPPLLFDQACNLNALILLKNLGPQHNSLYCHLLWDSCSIQLAVDPTDPKSFPLLPMLEDIPKSGTELISNLQDVTANHGIPEECSAPIFEDLRQIGAKNDVIVFKLLPALVKNAMIQGQDGDSQHNSFRLHAQMLACITKLLVNRNIESNNWKSATDMMQNVILLREKGHGETDPQVVQELWLLEGMYRNQGKLTEAAQVRKDCIMRIEKYVEDIPTSIV